MDATKGAVRSWHRPIPYVFVVSAESDSFKELCIGDQTVLPVGGHPGAFGTLRKNHRHEGVDLYCSVGTPVSAVESGIIVKAGVFTGELAGSPWWRDTLAVMVEGPSGVVVYGELGAIVVEVGQQVAAGQLLGTIGTVLKKDKGRPMTMLHLELHCPGSRDWILWESPDTVPELLLDPTAYLKDAKG